MASDVSGATFTPYTSLTDPIPGGDLLTLWGSSAPPPPGGETIATAQADHDLTLADTADFTLVGNPDSGEARVVQGDDGDSAAPFMPSGAKDTAPYLSIMGGEGAGTATLTTPGLDQLELYVGSLDTYNTVTFNFADSTSEIFDGAQLVDLAEGAGAASSFPFGNQTSPQSNGLLTFDFSAPLTSVSFGSSTTNAFEIADIGTSDLATIEGGSSPFGTPEPASWALMLIGVFGIGRILRHSRCVEVPVAV